MNPNLLTVLLTVGGAILGAIFAIIIAIVFESVKNPKLGLQIGKPSDLFFSSENPPKNARILGIDLINEKLSNPWNKIPRSPAVQCHGTINFYELNGQKLFNRAMEIRWSRSPQPIPTQGVLINEKKGNKRILIYDFWRIISEQQKDIYPGESERLDVAVRFENEKDCYGWNNETYFSDPIWRNPTYQLGPGCYLIKIEIVSSGKKCSGLYRLVNEGTINDFRIEPSQKDDKVIDLDL